MTHSKWEKLPSPLGRGSPAAGAFTSRSGTGEGSVGGVWSGVSGNSHCRALSLRTHTSRQKTLGTYALPAGPRGGQHQRLGLGRGTTDHNHSR